MFALAFGKLRKNPMLRRATLATTLLMVFATAARADLAPEPYEPESPTFWVFVVLAIAGAVAGYVVYRRRRK